MPIYLVLSTRTVRNNIHSFVLCVLIHLTLSDLWHFGSSWQRWLCFSHHLTPSLTLILKKSFVFHLQIFSLYVKIMVVNLKQDLRAISILLTINILSHMQAVILYALWWSCFWWPQFWPLLLPVLWPALSACNAAWSSTPYVIVEEHHHAYLDYHCFDHRRCQL